MGAVAAPVCVSVRYNCWRCWLSSLESLQRGEPFGIARIWEGWRHPESGELLRTFCIITTSANELLDDIHDRMPVILPPEGYDRCLANVEPDPRPVGSLHPGVLEPFEPVAGSTPNLL
jgi:hypothetical protein